MAQKRGGDKTVAGLKLKLNPVAHTSKSEQLGYLMGKLYGDNIVQYGVGVATPMLFNSASNAESIT